MLDGLELMGEARRLMAERDAAVADIPRLGREKAEARRRHRAALAKAEIEYRAGGMPASMVADAARGREDVSFMEFEADCAEAVYWANKEAIEAARDGLQVVREVMRREWER